MLHMYSGHALPRSYKALMNSEESDLIDFYPSGKPFFASNQIGVEFLDENGFVEFVLFPRVSDHVFDEQILNWMKKENASRGRFSYISCHFSLFTLVLDYFIITRQSLSLSYT